MKEEEVYYVSEHRGSFNNDKELPDIAVKNRIGNICNIDNKI